MKLVSACLIGVNCNFERKNCLQPILRKTFEQGDLFPVCCEVLGGLSIPRIPSEIVGGDGADVLDGSARVVSMEGKDVTQEFIKGAYEILTAAKAVGAKEALLTEKSPSCGCGKIFDGTFKGKLKTGDGVATALLKRNGVQVTCVKVKL